VITDATIRPLPAPVQRCIRVSNVLDRRVPRSVMLRQKGRIRQAPDARWLAFTAREIYSVDIPGFEWVATVRIGGVPLGRARDSLDSGRGAMRVKMLGIFPVVDATGPEMDQGSMMRWLNETMWFPGVWATDLFTWEAVDDTTAIGTVDHLGTPMSAEFRFDAAGRLVDFEADRHRDGVGVQRWSTPISSHTHFGDLYLPQGGVAVWDPADEAFEYIEIEATSVEYGP
jgi:hypothetical protein